MTYTPKNAPWAHQKVALDKMLNHRNFALLMAMRTGKSYVTTTDFGRMEKAGKADDFLVIAPAGVYRTWGTDFYKHASTDLAGRIRMHIWSADQTSRAAVASMTAFLKWRKGPRFLLVNVEALSSVKRAKEIVTEFASQRRCYCAVDESTTIKNVGSQRAKFVTEVLSPVLAFKRILSGLPTPRSPLDIYGQFLFLDKSILGFDNWVSFEKRYADIVKICILPSERLKGMLKKRAGGDTLMLPGIGKVDVDDLSRQDVLLELERRRVYVETIPKLSGYKNEEELATKIAPYSHRVKLEDCYDMPPKNYAIREVRLTAEQERMYDEMRRQAHAEILDEMEERGYVTAANVVTRMLKLHQILCGHTKDEDGKEHHFAERRTEEVISILKEYDGKAVIWVSYDADVRKVAEAIEDEFGEGTVARFWGGNRSTREKEEKRFLDDYKCRYLVATPAAGGRGRTWTIANLLIYYSNINNLEHRSQSEERASGVDKKDYVNCVDLVVPNTVDVKILEALRAKIDMAGAITGDNWREWVI